MLPLIGILIVIVGFALRLNALLVVTLAGVATGLVSGQSLPDVIAAFGKAFVDSRYIAIVWLALPVIGLAERSGLKERSREVISRIQAATAGRVLLVYLALRQATSALGLVSLGGHAQMVRPLVAPMAEGAADNTHGALPTHTRERIKSMAAASDNVGMFFGEDVFVAIGSILLIRGFLEQNGIVVEPLQLARWAIPTAIIAFVVHGARLLLLDRDITSAVRAERESSVSSEPRA
ncbi:DUF969 domain-containing protein [Gemmatimonas sp.]|uniref:DUF969 domain-containing protein n=1 Tax=Gemmatimonas sp. TaxID=1962908 RepID=UPI003F71D7C8